MNELDFPNVFLSSTVPDNRTVFYLSTFDKYFTALGLLDEDELKFYDDMEKEWRDSLPDYSFNELVQIFPEAKTAIKRNLKAEIKQCKADLLEAERIERECTDILTWRCPENEKWFWEAIVEGMFVAPLRNGREATIKRNTYRLATLERKEEVKTSGVSEALVEQAKQVSIKNFLKVGRDGKAVCIFHNDKNPSMHVYKDNHFYCFVCHTTGDVVDVVMRLNNMDFISAVKSLT